MSDGRESASDARYCPVCGGVNPSHDLGGDPRYCTPLSCSAWTFTHRLTKQGLKPIRRDGRADLKVAE